MCQAVISVYLFVCFIQFNVRPGRPEAAMQKVVYELVLRTLLFPLRNGSSKAGS